MVVNVKNIPVDKILVKFLQGSVVAQTVSGGLTIHMVQLQISVSLLYIDQKYENWLRDKVIAMKKVAFWPTLKSQIEAVEHNSKRQSIRNHFTVIS